jgi:antirestriction protein ArdC
MKTDLYNKVTDQIVASLEQGVRPWTKPWSAEHAAGRITRPLRANGIPYQLRPALLFSLGQDSNL